MIEIKIPTVGESINEVTVSEWTKKDGDYVEMDDIICELESDKATFELNAESAGIIHIKVPEGETIEIGTVVCTIDETAVKVDSDKTSTAPPKNVISPTNSSEPSEGRKTGEILEMKVPAVGESITEVTISAWMKQDGSMVELDEPIAEIESDKATFELAAETRGILSIVAQEGDTIEIGALICKIEVVTGPAPEVTENTPDVQPASPDDTQGYAAGHPSPAAAKILAEKGIPAAQIMGSGVGGRITKEDAQLANNIKNIQPQSTVSETVSQPQGGTRNQTRKKLTPLRKTISRRLVAVKNETAMLTTFNEVDMKPIMDLRKKYKEAFKEKYEVGLGFMSFFTTAVCQALQEWPAVNAQIDGDEIVYSDYCDVSIAVSAPKGLVVPVIRNAETMNFHQIEKEVRRLAMKARDNKLSIEEMQGGTFTITNGGVFGSMLSTPIINAPQSAILGMHNIVERPIAIDGQVEIRPIMYVALSYDHRIIDGRESVGFLVRLKQLLEDPARLMLGI